MAVLPPSRHPQGSKTGLLRALAVILALAAVVCMVLAIAGMVTARQSPRTGFVLQTLAVACFGAAIILNVAAH